MGAPAPAKNRSLITNWIEGGGGHGDAGVGVDWTVGDRDVFVPDAWWVTDEHRLARDAPVACASCG